LDAFFELTIGPTVPIIRGQRVIGRYPALLVTRTEAVGTSGAMIVGAREFQRSQDNSPLTPSLLLTVGTGAGAPGGTGQHRYLPRQFGRRATRGTQMDPLLPLGPHFESHSYARFRRHRRRKVDIALLIPGLDYLPLSTDPTAVIPNGPVAVASARLALSLRLPMATPLAHWSSPQ